jgi:hypothetical protein
LQKAIACGADFNKAIRNVVPEAQDSIFAKAYHLEILQCTARCSRCTDVTSVDNPIHDVVCNPSSCAEPIDAPAPYLTFSDDATGNNLVSVHPPSISVHHFSSTVHPSSSSVHPMPLPCSTHAPAPPQSPIDQLADVWFAPASLISTSAVLCDGTGNCSVEKGKRMLALTRHQFLLQYTLYNR